ncbi:DegT/DnrJ/EryC1/StrS family aminotransferase [soil metagenome]
MDGEEIKLVEEAFRSNWIAPAGPHLTAFENELKAYSGVPNCVALSSGTAGLHLALILLGVEKGDEVLCSTFTFSASCNPIVYLGATPVFVDSEKDTWNIDPIILEEAILDRIRKEGKAPKALVVVHLYGMPAKMDEINAVCSRHNVFVIEDAAEALGSVYNGRKAGNLSELSIFSFNGNKIITTSGGGALLGKSEKLIEKARFLSTQARDSAPHYQHSEIGYNYRLSNISAAIGRGQLMAIEKRVSRRRENFQFYKDHYQSTEFISFQPEPEGSKSNRWLTAILIEDSDKQLITREAVRLALEAENIESRPLWKPMHLQPVFQNYPSYGGAVSERMFEKGLCLPSGSSLTKADLERITYVIDKSIGI